MTSNLGQLIASDLAAIRARAAALDTPLQAADGSGATSSGLSFATRMQEALNNVNERDVAAGQQLAAVDSGQSDDLVGAMLSSQQASLSFSMLMQVRNKVMSAVDDLVKLPI